jgi:hypothetical protein
MGANGCFDPRTGPSSPPGHVAAASPWRWLAWLWGLLLVLLGSGLLLWIAYNLFVEMQPQAEVRNPVAPMLFAVVLVVIGIGKLRQLISARPRNGGRTPS